MSEHNVHPWNIGGYTEGQLLALERYHQARNGD